MEWLVLLVVLAVVIGMAIVFVEAWRAFQNKKRSIATAVAITCIVAGVPTVFAATCFETEQMSRFQQPLQSAAIVLMFGAGVSGAVGLVWDRRIARLRSRLEMDAPERNHLQECDRGEPPSTADQPRE